MENRDEIKKRMLSNVNDKYDKSEGNFISDIITSNAIEFEKNNNELEVIKSKLYIENLSGDELEQRIYENTGIRRKKATFSTTTVIITGDTGATIKVNDKASSDSVNFIVMETKSIDNTGKIDVVVQCEKPGIIGNVPAGAIKYFPVTLEGIISVINPFKVTNGYEAETDEELLERYYERIRTPATSGNKYHYRNWAKDVPGIGAAKIFPLWNGDNTVKVVIIDSNKNVADDELVKKVQDYIDPGIKGLGEGQAPIGAFCTVTSARAKVLNINFELIKDTSISDEERLEDITRNIDEYIKELAFMASSISINKIGSIILNSKGVIDYSNLTINASTGNITLTEEEIPVLGVITIV